MIVRDPPPRFELLQDAHEVKRVRTTISCTDADHLPKVDGAGSIVMKDSVEVQVMHNGVLIKEGCYGGQWMTEVIRSLHGHHEPQEEVVFDAMVRRLADDTNKPVMIEFGSFWTYYGMWFARALADSQVVAMEPDPHNLKIGEFNAELNGVTDRITFVHGAIGAEPGRTFDFAAESDGARYTVEQYDLNSLMALTNLTKVDLVLADVQGAETLLLERARNDFAQGRVRFLVVSTHHNSISGSALTHQRALQMLVDAGAHIIAEHSVPESFSGDGLIAVSFDPRDTDLVVPVSFARSKDSIFDEVEYELNVALTRLDAAQQAHDRVVNSRIWRWSAPARRAYSRFRSSFAS